MRDDREAGFGHQFFSQIAGNRAAIDQDHIASKTTPDEVVSLMMGAEAVHEMGVIPRSQESSEEAA